MSKDIKELKLKIAEEVYELAVEIDNFIATKKVSAGTGVSALMAVASFKMRELPEIGDPMKELMEIMLEGELNGRLLKEEKTNNNEETINE